MNGPKNRGAYRRTTIILFLLISISARTQEWVRTYGPNYWADWVIEHYDHGIIILASSQDYKLGWIIKTDINGSILWNKKIGNGQYTFAPTNIELTNDNGLVIAGTTSKYNNQQDAFILKLNTCGELIWCTDVYTPSIPFDLGWKVKNTNDNGYILLGEFNDPNQEKRTNLFKFDFLGNLVWHQSYFPDSLVFGEDAQCLNVDSSGYVVHARCYYPDPGQTTGIERFYLLKTDTSGKKLWSVVYGGDQWYYGYPSTSLISKTGGYYAFGKHDYISSGQEYPALIKFLHNGTQSYNKDIMTNTNQGGLGAASWMDDTTMLLACGWVINTYTVGTMLKKTDTLGNQILAANLPNLSSGIVSMAKLIDKKFICLATNFITSNTCYITAFKINSDLQWDSIYTRPFTYDSLCPHQIVSDTIDPSCNLVVNVEEPISNPETHQMHLFPNPTKGKLTIMLPKYLVVTDKTPPVQSRTIYHQWRSTTLLAYDLNGNQVFSQEIMKDQSQLELDVSSWSKGMYYFKLVYNGNSVDGKKVIVE